MNRTGVGRGPVNFSSHSQQQRKHVQQPLQQYQQQSTNAFTHSLIKILQKDRTCLGFTVIEESGLKIGSVGTLNRLSSTKLQDLLSIVRDITERTRAQMRQQAKRNRDGNNNDTYDTDDTQDDEDDDDDDDEEEIKVFLETKNNTRLVLSTVEAQSVCVVIHQQIANSNNNSNANDTDI